jgi:hypothetical protein
MSETAKSMKRSIQGLTFLTYLCWIAGIGGLGQDFYHQWRTAIVPTSVFSNLVLLMVGVCCSAILACVKMFDTRLTKLEAEHQPMHQIQS